MAPGNNKKVAQAVELLSQYVTYGAMRDPDQFDALFLQIIALLPPELKYPPLTAWRAMIVDDECIRSVDWPIHLQARNFSSWSKDRESAARCLRDRLGRAPAGKAGILIQKSFEAECLVADVEKAYRFLQWNSPDVEEWGRYVEWENELIVCNSPNLLTVYSHEIVHTQPATNAIGFGSTDEAGVMRPYRGEYVYDPEQDDDFIIADINADQPLLLHGIWQVADCDDRVWAVRFDSKGWSVVDQEIVDEMRINDRSANPHP